MEKDPLKQYKKNTREFCNINNKNKLSFSCFTEEDIYELVSIYNDLFVKKGYNVINILNKKNKERKLKDIYDDLKNNLIKINKNNEKEFCWLKIKEFKRRFVNRENLFVPKMPVEWCNDIKLWRISRIDAPWLSNFDIDGIVEQYENKYPSFKFLGSTPIDFRKKKYDRCILSIFRNDKSSTKWLKNNDHKTHCDYNPFGYPGKDIFGIVFNTDTHDSSGKHWMSLYINVKKKCILFFDSAVTYSQLHPEIEAFIKNIKNQYKNTKFTFKYNKVQHQQSNSECGMYSIYFILTMLDADKHEDTNTDCITVFDEYFNNNNNRITDKLMVLYRTKLFRSDCDCL